MGEGDRGRFGRRLPKSRLGTLTVLGGGALVAVVAAVGAVALVAEFRNTWEWYFLMERAIAAATPVATALFVLTVLVGIGAAVRTG